MSIMPRGRDLKSYLAVFAFFALGLMAKPMLVTLPFVLLLLDYWPLERFGQTNPLRKSVQRQASLFPRKKEREIEQKAGTPDKSTGVAKVEKPADRKYQWALIRPLVLGKDPPLCPDGALKCRNISSLSKKEERWNLSRTSTGHPHSKCFCFLYHLYRKDDLAG